jgi:hypothetical protein
MKDPTSRLADDADAIRSTAQRLHDQAADPACAPLVPAALEAIEDALTKLSRTCYTMAHAFVPLGDSDTSIAERYARAAMAWPSPRGGTGPSHEQQARVLSSMQEAAAALRAAAARCRRAADNLAATMEPVEELPERDSEAA